MDLTQNNKKSTTFVHQIWCAFLVNMLIITGKKLIWLLVSVGKSKIWPKTGSSFAGKLTCFFVPCTEYEHILVKYLFGCISFFSCSFLLVLSSNFQQVQESDYDRTWVPWKFEGSFTENYFWPNLIFSIVMRWGIDDFGLRGL